MTRMGHHFLSIFMVGCSCCLCKHCGWVAEEDSMLECDGIWRDGKCKHSKELPRYKPSTAPQPDTAAGE